MSLLVLVVDDEPDVEVLFRQHFRVTSVLVGSPWASPNRVLLHVSASMMPQGITHLNPLRHQHAWDERS
jgi:hypothetical protein